MKKQGNHRSLLTTAVQVIWVPQYISYTGTIYIHSSHSKFNYLKLIKTTLLLTSLQTLDVSSFVFLSGTRKSWPQNNHAPKIPNVLIFVTNEQNGAKFSSRKQSPDVQLLFSPNFPALPKSHQFQNNLPFNWTILPNDWLVAACSCSLYFFLISPLWKQLETDRAVGRSSWSPTPSHRFEWI